MECGTTPYTTSNPAAPYTNGTGSNSSTSGSATNQLSGQSGRQQTSERSPARAGLHVNFQEKGEVKEKKEKFLTAKYGHHQMSLIRKRLAVEMWLYEEVNKLYETPASKKLDDEREEIDVDIDQLLDMDNDEMRRLHLEKLLIGAIKSQNDVKKFINDLLAKAKTL